MVAAGSVLGASSIIAVPNDVCIVRAVWRGSKFYSHESCGKCTPCREGTYWVESMLERIEHGRGRPGDVDRLFTMNNGMSGFKSPVRPGRIRGWTGGLVDRALPRGVRRAHPSKGVPIQRTGRGA